jgi:hypothetical protein
MAAFGRVDRPSPLISQRRENLRHFQLPCCVKTSVNSIGHRHSEMPKGVYGGSNIPKTFLVPWNSGLPFKSFQAKILFQLQELFFIKVFLWQLYRQAPHRGDGNGESLPFFLTCGAAMSLICSRMETNVIHALKDGVVDIPWRT